MVAPVNHSQTNGNGALSKSNFLFAFNVKEHSNGILSLATKGKPADTTDIFVNTAILAKESAFFQRFFQSGFALGDSTLGGIFLSGSAGANKKVLEVEDKEGVLLLLKAIYAGGTPEDPDKVEDLMKLMVLGQEYGAPSVVEFCSKSLQANSLTLRRAVEIMMLPAATLALHPPFQGLLQQCRDFVEATLTDLDNVIGLPDSGFYSLPLPAVRHVLSSDKVRVHSEDVVFFLCLEWVRTNVTGKEGVASRVDALKQLWPVVRFPQMTTDCLVAIQDIEEAALSVDPKVIQAALRSKSMDPRAVRLLFPPPPSPSPTDGTGASQVADEFLTGFVPRPGVRKGPAQLVWIVGRRDIEILDHMDALNSSRVFISGCWYCIELLRLKGLDHGAPHEPATANGGVPAEKPSPTSTVGSFITSSKVSRSSSEGEDITMGGGGGGGAGPKAPYIRTPTGLTTVSPSTPDPYPFPIESPSTATSILSSMNAALQNVAHTGEATLDQIGNSLVRTQSMVGSKYGKYGDSLARSSFRAVSSALAGGLPMRSSSGSPNGGSASPIPNGIPSFADVVQIRLASKAFGPREGYCPSLGHPRVVEVSCSFKTPAGHTVASTSKKLILFKEGAESHGMLELAWDSAEMSERIFDENGKTIISMTLQPLSN